MSGIKRKLYIEVKIIYDGACKFIRLNVYELPLQFRVLEDDIPINYWIGINGLSIYRDSESTKFNLFHNKSADQTINIDLRKHRKEILDNLIDEGQDLNLMFNATSTLAGNTLWFMSNEPTYELLNNLDIITFVYNKDRKVFKT